MKVDPSAVDRVKVKNSNGEFTLKRAAAGKWDVIVGGKTSEGDIPVVERLLNQFRDLKGQSIVADPMPSAQPFGLDNPTLEITLVGKDGKELGAIKFAKMSVKERRRQSRANRRSGRNTTRLRAVAKRSSH